ncbi:M28 family peptidase [uncultured Sphingorhabdus sp.]|uniref:M28 family peptidase n=1 Tax=uncultured Sphingorhabdus sp. TaxID=1686106 RepID=UPI00260B493D|nr:M28 family peptidase [uncultured Sphingorhabdus sp.]HMS22102.1 M28 family peptidase [Sphingorhabdus sp.]
MRARLILSIFLAFGFIGSVVAKPVTEAELRKHVEILASDDFEGRGPGTEGERKTLAYLESQWTKAGLKPAARDGSWYQPVDLVRRGPKQATVQFFAKGEKLRIVSDDILLVGKEAEYRADRLPALFVGHGVNAQGKVVADVKGKLAFLLADDAEFLPSEMKASRNRRLALVDAGAAGVVSISGEQFDFPLYRRAILSRPISWVARDKRADVEGAVSPQYMVALVTAAGGDWDKLRAAARSTDYAGQSLGLTVDLNVLSDVEPIRSNNIIGKFAGRKPDSGAVVLMGHWDHFGVCRPESDEDRICNGAVDNASGMAVLTEVAKRLGKAKFDRDIYFIGTTAEEYGLIGARAFAADPAVALDQIKVVLNVDTVAIAPKGAKVAIIGRGKTDLDADVEAIARKLKRKIEPSTDANAFLQRQDGWALTEKNVPALMVGGSFADLGKLEAFLKTDYHGPKDEVVDTLQLGGAAEDADLHVELGRYFADTRKYKPKKAEKGTGE